MAIVKRSEIRKSLCCWSMERVIILMMIIICEYLNRINTLTT